MTNLMTTQMTTRWVTTKSCYDSSLVEDVMMVEDSLGDRDFSEKVEIIHRASGANINDIGKVLSAYREQVSPWVE